MEITSLKPKCRVWYHLFKSRVNPSTHNSTISNEMMLQLHSIMIGKKINVGKFIFKEIHHYAQKNARSLNFPSLITTMYQRVNVPIQANENTIQNKRAITK